MSDTTPTAFDYAVGPEQELTRKFTTYKWQEVLGTAAYDRYRIQRKAALRFLVIPPIFLGLHALLTHLHVRQGVVSLMMILVIIPLYFFRELMKDVAYRSTAAGMIGLFELMKFTDDEDMKTLTTGEFKELLFEHFCLTGKKKQRRAAVDKFLTTNTGAKKPLMWLSVLFLAVALIVISGPFFGLIFALAFACTILTTVRYFRAATPPLKRLGDITLQLGDNPSSESDDTEDESTSTAPTGKKAKKAAKSTSTASAGDDTNDETAGLSDEDLLKLITAYNDGTGTSQDNQFLELYCNGRVPATDEFRKEIARSTKAKKAAKSTSTAPAGDDTTALPPLPKRAKKTVAASQPGSTGTPAATAPVPTSAPAPAAPTTEPKDVGSLLDKYYAGEPLTTDEMKLIEPILYTDER